MTAFLMVVFGGITVTLLVLGFVTLSMGGWVCRVAGVVVLGIAVVLPFVGWSGLQERADCKDRGGVYVRGHCVAPQP